MLKKLVKNLKLSLILFIIVVGFFWISEDFLSSVNFIKSSWWFWLILPFGLRFYNWFKNLKQKAFNYGADATGERAENKALQKDKKEKLSEKEYQKLLTTAQFSKEEATKIRSQINPESLRVQKELAENYTIPLYHYISGLPGNNLIRPTELKTQFTKAKISNNVLEFYNELSQDFENPSFFDIKFSEIPLASIQKIEIIDLVKNRELKRISAYLGRRVAQSVINAASQTGGATITKSNVVAAQLIISYVNEDGVIMPAIFLFNSNSKFGLKAMDNLQLLNKTLKSYSLLGKLNWHTETLSATESITDGLTDSKNGFEISEATALAGDLITILKWANMLSPHDSAILAAKLSAEMIAGVLQNPSVPLIEMTK